MKLLWLAAAASVFWTQFSGPASILNPLDGAFSYVNGTFHRAITKPFILAITGALYSDSQHLTGFVNITKNEVYKHTSTAGMF